MQHSSLFSANEIIKQIHNFKRLKPKQVQAHRNFSKMY